MMYYTSTIPLPLAEKLKEKGMKVEIVCDNTEEHSFPPEYHCETIFAECFDWLMSRGVNISLHQGRTDVFVDVYSAAKENYFRKPTWHEAANDAIEKALNLI